MTTNSISITRRVEFDAGHRVPDHQGQCRNLHGHRYALEVTVVGQVRQEPGNPENGMVTDFGQLKDIMINEIVQPWDHALLVSKTDNAVLEAIKAIPNHKTVILDVVPTVENLVVVASQKLAAALSKKYSGSVSLQKVRLYETPNCWSDALL